MSIDRVTVFRGIREWGAFLISVGAVGISSWSLHETRTQHQENLEQAKQNQLRTAILDTPIVSIYEEDDTDYPIVGLQIQNEGSTPAEVKRLTYYVDRRPTDDIEEVLKMGNLAHADVKRFEFGDHDRTLAVSEKQWLMGLSTKGNKKDLNSFIDFIGDHVEIETEVCSRITGKCETQCTRDGWCK